MIRIWCGLHQLDLVMQRIFKNALDDDFYTKLTGLIGHPRRQKFFISSMRSTCLSVSDVRWILMCSSSKWLTDNIISIPSHLYEKKPRCTPDNAWRIFLFAVHALTQESKIVFETLQGLSTLLSQQHAKLSGVVDTYCRMTRMIGPLAEADMAQLDMSNTEVCGAFAITYNDYRSFLDGLDMWIIEAMTQLEADSLHGLVVAVAKVFFQAANGIYDVVVRAGL